MAHLGPPWLRGQTPTREKVPGFAWPRAALEAATALPRKPIGTAWRAVVSRAVRRSAFGPPQGVGPLTFCQRWSIWLSSDHRIQLVFRRIPIYRNALIDIGERARAHAEAIRPGVNRKPLSWESSMKMLLLFAAAGAVMLPSVAVAQAAPTQAAPALSAGVVVYDPQGGEVGKIESVAGETVVLDTGTNKATLPRNAFGSSDKGPTVNATKAQIDALVANAEAKADAALAASLVPGAEVRGKAGAVIGTIKQVDGEQVIVDRVDGSPVSLNKAVFTAGPSGLTITMTADELDAAAQAASS